MGGMELTKQKYMHIRNSQNEKTQPLNTAKKQRGYDNIIYKIINLKNKQTHRQFKKMRTEWFLHWNEQFGTRF